MPLLMRFLVSYANRSNCFSSHIFGELDLPPWESSGRAIALLGVGKAPSGDRISTAHFTRDWQTPSRAAQKYIARRCLHKPDCRA